MFTLRKGGSFTQTFRNTQTENGLLSPPHSLPSLSLPKYEGLYSEAGAPRTGTPGRNALRLPPATRVGRWTGLGLDGRSRRPPASCRLLPLSVQCSRTALLSGSWAQAFLSFPVSVACFTVLLRLLCVSVTRGLVQTRVQDPAPEGGRGVACVCISSKFPGDAHEVCLRDTF